MVLRETASSHRLLDGAMIISDACIHAHDSVVSVDDTRSLFFLVNSSPFSMTRLPASYWPFDDERRAGLVITGSRSVLSPWPSRPHGTSGSA